VSETPESPWWQPDRHYDRRPRLLARNRVKQALRNWFLDQGFVEVETAALQVSPGNETHLHAFATALAAPDGTPTQPLYLHTSPEFACKKLLAAGEKRIFTFAPCYRNREASPRHHPEFTMLEWYRAGTDYRALMADCAAILAIASTSVGTPTFRQPGFEIAATVPPDEITVAEALRRHAGIDLMATLSSTGTDRDALARMAAGAGVRTAADDTWSDIFSRLLVEKVEPHLGRTAPTILKDYPLPEAALAAPSAADPLIAERFELYLCSLELANAFTELADPAEQRRRFEADMAEKERLYGERYPIDEDFLAALALMPPAAGAALGFDRLVMAATGAHRIEQVLWTPLPLGDT
jgi:lysyl-tRNA synthetase class 2